MRLPLEGAVEQSETEGVNFARRKWYEGWDIIELLPPLRGPPPSLSEAILYIYNSLCVLSIKSRKKSW